ncbi:urease accessory protein [Geosmithia morbida]|uniref:Urease accessory protein n=1 Tax=Geosmithia morbida TaxID=1094350 RepID=A0A9P4YQD2_9HYPO|nr:urease accessory protein [Geosmithia morbida]KAF4120825.1 urease accessory protein [Geosmithia morbida]
MASEAADLQDEIDQLQSRLKEARARLKSLDASTVKHHDIPDSLGSPTHFLLLLSDSALPLGSFAFSSGLESYLAHSRGGVPGRAAGSMSSFLPSSVSSLASTTLPFVLAAHRDPTRLADLDDELDAAIMCAVGRRASVAQGRALLSIWERSFRSSSSSPTAMTPVSGSAAEWADTLRDFSALLRSASSSSAADRRDGGGADDETLLLLPAASAHLAPLFGALCRVLGLGLRQTAYIFVLGHVKALLSAAVRASMFGPYQAQKVLAGEQVQRMIDVVIEREWFTPVEEAGQTVPVLDLWIGRHELLYSRIFNS